MKRIWLASLSAATLALLTACGGGGDDPAAPSTSTPVAVSGLYTSDFSQAPANWAGWNGESSDYTAATAPTGVAFEQRALPAPYVDTKAMFIGGRNNSDDAFLYIKKQFTGLTASTNYTFTIQANLVSSAPSGCLGVGGAPGESVYVIAAASPTEPKATADSTGYTKVNIDRGNQGTPGAASMVLGNIANGVACNAPPRYVAKLLRNTTGITVKTDAEGKVWVLFGIDSGFEDTSSIYLQSLTISFVPVTTT
ncbi:hypothetical protein [Massilia endophytica]|uniref:hypothetical protein n=1 Tax=Massilia endophytica TaxID=2899220 RepID=UPI001E531BED|nr:hypothetical protein [Massilia endophytica]UGQ44990.1 hypothetical protein LSQ66_14410 [Massilia endophytica]